MRSPGCSRRRTTPTRLRAHSTAARRRKFFGQCVLPAFRMCSARAGTIPRMIRRRSGRDTNRSSTWKASNNSGTWTGRVGRRRLRLLLSAIRLHRRVRFQVRNRCWALQLLLRAVPGHEVGTRRKLQHRPHFTRHRRSRFSLIRQGRFDIHYSQRNTLMAVPAGRVVSGGRSMSPWASASELRTCEP